MRNLITIIFFSILSIQTTVSQSILAYSHLQETYFETDIPDSLFVIHGERVQSPNNFYVERDYTLSQFDIFLTNHPGTCRIFNEFAGQVTYPKRLNLESATEVFLTEDIEYGYDLQNQKEVMYLIKHQLFTKQGVIDFFKVKSIKLIFLDEYGDVTTSEKFYENKFFLHLLVKHLCKS